MGDRDKDVEILALRHQITVLERQFGTDTKVRLVLEDRAFLAALLATSPWEVLCRNIRRRDRSAEFFTSTHMQLELHVSSFRQAQCPGTELGAGEVLAAAAVVPVTAGRRLGESRQRLRRPPR
ncbi:hypothetical protein [Nonomuraea sp. NPDC003709]|uniref:hypothetical protein n=1 Tax=Nonomuraea sp. NPDC003709 TaxID=3154450 RepID=UPI0033A06872